MKALLSLKHKLVGGPSKLIRERWPDGTEMEMNGKPFTFVPYDLTNVFLLKQLGVEAPSPILHDYDWPGPYTPFDIQKKTAAHLTMHPSAYVLNELGTGKTRAVLWAWDYLASIGGTGRLLIVAPLSTLNFVWAREIMSCLPHRKYAVLHGTREQRRKALAKAVDIYIINHDGVKTILDDLVARKDINALVIDELAVYRNGQAVRTKTMREFAKGKAIVWGMTGSPIPNEPTDAWAQATIVTPHTVPRYFGRFRDDLMLKIDQFRWVPKADAVEKAFKALQPAVRYTLDEVVELPEIISRFIDVEQGPDQAAVYKAMLEECYAMVQSQEITAANAGAAMMKLLQVSCGWVYDTERNVVTLDNDIRIRTMFDEIMASARKVLVFVPFKHALAGISEFLTDEGVDHATMSGSTPAGERASIFHAFQGTSKYHVLAAHPQCLAHGVTLTTASTIIWFSPTISLEIYEQANARIRRVGQKSKQLILHLQSTQIERRMYALLQRKQSVQDKLMELFEVETKGGDAL
jgi:SNF2 family DNA or RNA helicase